MLILRHLLLILVLLSTFTSPSNAVVSTVKATSDFSGLSTDTKPSGQQPGSKFYETDSRQVFRYDGAVWDVIEWKGALSIHDADVHNTIINRYVHKELGASTTLSANSAINDYVITVTSAVGFSVGEYLHVNSTTEEATHPRITGISGNDLTLDRRLDKAHFIGDEVNEAVVDMTSLVGAMASPQEYVAGPPTGEVWHVTRILFSMTHGTAGDNGLFGNLTALTNGVLLRARINGEYGTLTNWKTNGDIKTDMFNVEFDSRSGGGGAYGTSGRGTFTETGAVLRLDGDNNDQFEIYVQDDITTMDVFTMKVQGHVEGN